MNLIRHRLELATCQTRARLCSAMNTSGTHTPCRILYSSLALAYHARIFDMSHPVSGSNHDCCTAQHRSHHDARGHTHAPLSRAPLTCLFRTRAPVAGCLPAPMPCGPRCKARQGRAVADKPHCPAARHTPCDLGGTARGRQGYAV